LAGRIIIEINFIYLRSAISGSTGLPGPINEMSRVTMRTVILGCVSISEAFATGNEVDQNHNYGNHEQDVNK
jgi:hypothetical protein